MPRAKASEYRPPHGLKNLGSLLTKFRERLDISKRTLAKHCLMSIQAVSDLERGLGASKSGKVVTKAKLRDLADFLGLDWEVLDAIASGHYAADFEEMDRCEISSEELLKRLAIDFNGPKPKFLKESKLTAKRVLRRRRDNAKNISDRGAKGCGMATPSIQQIIANWLNLFSVSQEKLQNQLEELGMSKKRFLEIYEGNSPSDEELRILGMVLVDTDELPIYTKQELEQFRGDIKNNPLAGAPRDECNHRM